MTRTVSKKELQERVRRMLAHREDDTQPVDAATLLREEGRRLDMVDGRLSRVMSWACNLAAAKLDAWSDRTMTVRYQKVVKPPVAPPGEGRTVDVDEEEYRLLLRVHSTSSDVVKARDWEEFAQCSGGVDKLESLHTNAVSALEQWYREGEGE